MSKILYNLGNKWKTWVKIGFKYQAKILQILDKKRVNYAVKWAHILHIWGFF